MGEKEGLFLFGVLGQVLLPMPKLVTLSENAAEEAETGMKLKPFLLLLLLQILYTITPSPHKQSPSKIPSTVSLLSSPHGGFD